MLVKIYLDEQLDRIILLTCTVDKLNKVPDLLHFEIEPYVTNYINQRDFHKLGWIYIGEFKDVTRRKMSRKGR